MQVHIAVVIVLVCTCTPLENGPDGICPSYGMAECVIRVRGCRHERRGLTELAEQHASLESNHTVVIYTANEVIVR
jgi:hypothetical protein